MVEQHLKSDLCNQIYLILVISIYILLLPEQSLGQIFFSHFSPVIPIGHLQMPLKQYPPFKQALEQPILLQSCPSHPV